MWIRSATTYDHEVVVETTAGRLRLQGVGERIMRVVFSARPAPSTRVSRGVLAQQYTAPTLQEHEDRWTASTGSLACTIDKRTGAFTWTDADGTLLFREPHDGTQTKVLEEDGRFEVRVAGNGFDAGMMVKEYRPDLIVLDVMLPDINGKEVCHRVRADPSLEDVRILCISGMIEDDKIQELKLSGADDFLHKPFDIEELIDRMCAQLEIEPVPTTA